MENDKELDKEILKNVEYIIRQMKMRKKKFTVTQVCLNLEDMYEIKNSIKKQFPKITSNRNFLENGHVIFMCPKCQKVMDAYVFGGVDVHYCLNCGQKIEFKD